MLDWSADSIKLRVVHNMFSDQADRNYVLACRAYHAGDAFEFGWQASQAIEKYAKAALVLNGRSVKIHGHDLLKLCQDLESILGSDSTKLLPLDSAYIEEDPFFVLVSRLGNRYTLREFLECFSETDGDADNRYAMFGCFCNHSGFLNIQDLIHHLKGLSIYPLDSTPFRDEDNQPVSSTVREILIESTSAAKTLGYEQWMKIAKQYDDAPSFTASLTMNNYRFSGSRKTKGTSWTERSALGSIVSALTRPFEKYPEEWEHLRSRTIDADEIADALELAYWLFKSVKLDDNVVQQIFLECCRASNWLIGNSSIDAGHRDTALNLLLTEVNKGQRRRLRDEARQRGFTFKEE
jgi:HEPN domain-containing protein